MRRYHSDDPLKFKDQALQWAYSFDIACYFDSNNYADPYSAFDVMIAAGSEHEISDGGPEFGKLVEFLENSGPIVPGFFSYDLKNKIEDLESANPDHLHFPELFFFIPSNIILIKKDEITIYSRNPQTVWEEISARQAEHAEPSAVKIESRFSKSEYLKTVDHLKNHIKRGDVYEITFCQEFFAQNAQINPLNVFKSLNAVSPTPFANFFKIREKYILSATPERFLSKRGGKIISQPIKGTARRSISEEEDLKIKDCLQHDEKEKAENVMIVDLVRNDLTRIAEPGTVMVEELFGIYSFKQVHQMISTVVCRAAIGISNTEIIKNTFPMGSMTGAPKMKAMQLIEQYEKSKRGVFSGALGYFSQNGDFDFNVVIRTILYNAASKYLSFQAGSAITFDSNADHEYEECLLKASAIQEVLNTTKNF